MGSATSPLGPGWIKVMNYLLCYPSPLIRSRVLSLLLPVGNLPPAIEKGDATRLIFTPDEERQAR